VTTKRFFSSLMGVRKVKNKGANIDTFLSSETHS